MNRKPLSKKKILIVEDDKSVRLSLEVLLSKQANFLVTMAQSLTEAKEAWKEESYALVISDFKLPDGSGLELLSSIRAEDTETPFIIITGYGTISIAVEAMKCGANEFITKPFAAAELLHAIDSVLLHKRGLHRTPVSKSSNIAPVCESASMKRIMHFANRVASVDSPVVISGESGSGKEVLARYIHQQSPRRDEPFIALHCGSLPEEILESELFGHEAGAYTGATQKRIGLIEFAANGTLFLDEIGDMPKAVQVKLLRVLQEHEIRPLGANQAVSVSPRIIASSNQDIDALLDSGTLREDFYYRVAVVTLDIPPLRERPEDLDLLIKEFMQSLRIETGNPTLSLHKEALKALKNYAWPGNIRELQNTLERAVVLTKDTITVDDIGLTPELAIHLLGEAQQTLMDVSRVASDAAEKEVIIRVLQQTHGNKSEAARILNVSYKTLLSRIQRFQLEENQATALDS